MFQKSVIIKDLDDLKSKLPFLKVEFDSHDYKCGIIEARVGDIPEEELSEILSLLRLEFPEFEITGMSSFATVALFYHIEKGVILSFTLMQHAGVRVFSNFVGANADSEILSEAHDFAVKIREEIQKIDSVKGIEIFLGGRSAPSPILVNELSKGLEHIPIYGAVAGANRKELFYIWSKEDVFVISNEQFGKGVSIAVYYGEDLYTYVDYLFGWAPIGRYMDVQVTTDADEGTIILNRLDGEKPIDVYNKYFGVRGNESFIMNIGEFPLVVERDGFIMGRTPMGVKDNGELFLEGDLRNDEKVRFSFGEHQKVLEGTRNGAERMRLFEPEYLSLIICGNRLNFFQEEFHYEIDYYSKGRYEEVSLCLGMGEIYRYNGQGGILNSALIAIGMREGIGEDDIYEFSLGDKIEHSHKSGIIPLSERLSHFLSTITGELVEAVEEAEAANEAKSNFLSNMSHEIRTPINAVLGLDEMILRESTDPKITEYAQDIKTAGNTLLGLINDVLDFSKIEAGKMDIVPVDYDFSSLVNDLVHMIIPRMDTKGLELKAEIDSNIPNLLFGDEIRIKQVITNILTNAVKYTEEGTISLIVEHERISQDEIKLIVKVKDTGIGIKEEDLGRLSEAFRRVDEARNRTIEGTGLGLNITQKILTLMDSKLNVKSVYGEGSEFSFEIKQKIVNDEPIGDYVEAYKRAVIEKKVYHEKFTAPLAKVLVVDDTSMNLTVFEGLLKKTKMQIDKAESGEECLEKTRLTKYDIIFLDHRMPIMDGIETLQKLKNEATNPNLLTTAISLTANAVSGAREKYIEAGFDDYITKPIMSEKLDALLIKYLPPEKVNLIERAFDDNKKEEEAKEKAELPKWIKDAPIDVKTGMKNCGSAENFVQAAQTFKDSIDRNCEAIEQFLEDEDIKNYTIKVHALKSSARIIGAEKLSALAEALEAAGDAVDIDRIKRDTPELLKMYRELREAFFAGDEEAEDNSSDDLPLMEEDAVTELKNTLKEIAGTFDYDSINYIMETVKGYRVPKEHKEFFTALQKAVANADWDEINRLL
ncbi:Signal transduction histidine kinase [Butyrivibrio sp. ob235]|uniref:ATP-binding protein n=1 Tax=Butyrivibrio sp. ob235 TaxID=1761780 RepID=UPI0008C3F202|nr:ATP-binding protein [Butyrivibrio sp. ob235]SEM40740.1 Signal transduction histidine kinase [Butyrivibrio sp. ob235]